MAQEGQVRDAGDGTRQNKTKHPLTLRKGQGLELTRVSVVQDKAWTGLECLGEEQGAKPQGLGKVSAEGCRTDVLGDTVPSLSSPSNSLWPWKRGLCEQSNVSATLCPPVEASLATGERHCSSKVSTQSTQHPCGNTEQSP